jgi:DNA-3-methyladenine glycosylase I
MSEVPARTAESDALSKDLVRRGFRFVGSTICYAFMQGVGMVNDHTIDCFRYREVSGRAR